MHYVLVKNFVILIPNTTREKRVDVSMTTKRSLTHGVIYEPI